MNPMKSFFTKLSQLLRKNEFDGPDQEMGAEPARHLEAIELARHQKLDWAKITVAFCFASAIEIALVSAQLHSQLPEIFYFLALAILFAFTSIFMSTFVPSNCPEIALVIQRTGVFFGVTAFFISISIPFPCWFKWTTCFIYVVSWLVVIFCNYLNNRNVSHRNTVQ